MTEPTSIEHPPIPYAQIKAAFEQLLPTVDPATITSVTLEPTRVTVWRLGPGGVPYVTHIHVRP